RYSAASPATCSATSRTATRAMAPPATRHPCDQDPGARAGVTGAGVGACVPLVLLDGPHVPVVIFEEADRAPLVCQAAQSYPGARREKLAPGRREDRSGPAGCAIGSWRRSSRVIASESRKCGRFACGSRSGQGEAMTGDQDVRRRLARYVLTDGFHLTLDLRHSRGSWIVDAGTGERYLDLYAFYASAPLG